MSPPRFEGFYRIRRATTQFARRSLRELPTALPAANRRVVPMRRVPAWSMLRLVIRRVCCAALTALALTAIPDAQATTLVLEDGTAAPQPYQSWVDSALVPTPPGNVTLRLGGCPQPEFVSCEERSERTLDLDPGWMSRPVLLHELGHVFDDAMPAWARARFAAIVHRRDPWEGPVNPPSEWFAEAY